MNATNALPLNEDIARKVLTTVDVAPAVRRFKIRLNDARWSSNAARTNGLRKLAIAQLGSETIDQKEFARIVVEQTIRRIVPIALRAAAKLCVKFADSLEAAAKRCEDEGTLEAAREARQAAADAAAADAAAAYAAAAADAAYAAAYAADAAADAAAYAYAARDEVLNIAAEIGLEALKRVASEGCKYLYLAE